MGPIAPKPLAWTRPGHPGTLQPMTEGGRYFITLSASSERYQSGITLETTYRGGWFLTQDGAYIPAHRVAEAREAAESPAIASMLEGSPEGTKTGLGPVKHPKKKRRK